MINTKQFRNIFYSYITQILCFPGDQSKREHGLLLLVLVHNRVSFVETTHLCAKLPCIYRANLVWIKLFKTQSENYLRIFVHALEGFFWGGHCLSFIQKKCQLRRLSQEIFLVYFQEDFENDQCYLFKLLVEFTSVTI